MNVFHIRTNYAKHFDQITVNNGNISGSIYARLFDIARLMNPLLDIQEQPFYRQNIHEYVWITGDLCKGTAKFSSFYFMEQVNLVPFQFVEQVNLVSF